MAVRRVNSRMNLRSCQSSASASTGVPEKDVFKERYGCIVLPWSTELEKKLECAQKTRLLLFMLFLAPPNNASSEFLEFVW